MSEGKKINPEVIVKLMGKTIKSLVARNTGKRKVVATADALKPLAENKNRRGVVVIKNIKSILEDRTKLARLRARTQRVIEENPRDIQADIIKKLVKSIEEDPSMMTDEGFNEIVSVRFSDYIRNVESVGEGVESKQEKEPEVKTQKPLDVIDIKASTKELKSWLDSNASKYYESLDSKDENQQRIRNYYEDRLEEFTRRELRQKIEKEEKEKTPEKKVEIVKPTIAQRTQDEPDAPKVIMTKPKIESLPITQRDSSDLKRIESSNFFGQLMNRIYESGTHLNFEPGYLTTILEQGINSLPTNYRRILQPILESARGGGTMEVARGLTHLGILLYVLPALGFSPKDPIYGIVGDVLGKTSDKIFDYMRELSKDNKDEIDNLLKGEKPDGKKPDKKIPDEPDDKQPEGKQPEVKQSDSKLKRIVPPLVVGAGIAGGAMAYASKDKKPATATPAQAPPPIPDTLERVVDTATSGISSGIGAVALNEMRRQIVDARPETKAYIDSLGAEALTNILGGILGYKTGEVIKEKTDVKEKIKDVVKKELGIKETPIQYDPKVLEESTATYEQKQTAKNRIWQPKTIYPTTSILDESNQEKYIDDIEASAFDYIAPTSEGSAGTIYTNPLKRQQYINERMRLEGAGMYIPYKTWGRVNDPSKMTEEQLRLMLLGPKLPELKFYEMDNATTFENVQTVHLVNNEQNSIEMFSPYSQFSNVDNNWWTNEDSVLYTINP